MIKITLPISTVCVFKFITSSVKFQILSLRDLLKFNKRLLLSMKVKTKCWVEGACWECASHRRNTSTGGDWNPVWEDCLCVQAFQCGRTASTSRCSQCRKDSLYSQVLPLWGGLTLYPGAPSVEETANIQVLPVWGRLPLYPCAPSMGRTASVSRRSHDGAYWIHSFGDVSWNDVPAGVALSCFLLHNFLFPAEQASATIPRPLQVGSVLFYPESLAPSGIWFLLILSMFLMIRWRLQISSVH